MRLGVLLLELLSAATFIASGAVIGFCGGGLLGPALFGRGGHGLEELGFMFNGAILGATFGVLLGALALWRLSRPLRLRMAATAFAASITVALATWVLVSRFDAW